MRLFYLNKLEIATLFLQDSSTKSDGGFQSFLVKLQQQLDRASGLIKLHPKDIDRIYRYSRKYKQGGWQNMLFRIFGRVMPTLLQPLGV